jgi:hypothetical protein
MAHENGRIVLLRGPTESVVGTNAVPGPLKHEPKEPGGGRTARNNDRPERSQETGLCHFLAP